MRHPLAVKNTAMERYQSMEHHSGHFFLVLLAVSFVGWVYLEPEPTYPLICLVVGAFAFLSNLKSAHGKIGVAFVLAAVGILGGVAFIPPDLGKLGSVLIAASHIGLSMFGLIHARKWLLSREEAGRGR